MNTLRSLPTRAATSISLGLAVLTNLPILMLLASGLFSEGHAAPGALDPTFGSGGKVTTPISSYDDAGQSAAVQSDGKIVVAGYSANGSSDDFALARYTVTGALDTNFGSGGKVTTAIGVSSAGNVVVVQSDGKIIVAGSSYNGSDRDFALARYTASGTLDSGFGSGGKVATPIGSGHDYGYSAAVQSDGKILVAGYSWNGNNNEFALVRYTATGALDGSFGSGGKVTTMIGSSSKGYSVAVQSDGKIVVAGSSINGSNSDFALVRYTATGALDVSFGSGGKVTTPIGSADDQGRSVVLQSDGKIVIAGYSNYNGANYDFAVVRYMATGAPDPTFGSSGKVVTPFGSSDDIGQSMAVQANGKIVVAGFFYIGGNYAFALVRYTTTGALDTSFGSGGKATSTAGWGASVAVQSDGKIVVAGAGYAVNLNYKDFVVVRHLGDDTPNIIVQPQAQIVTAGSNVTLNVSASGTAPNYQWRLNGVNIAGATNPTLTISNAQLANAGHYSVVVTNSLGQATSAAAKLTVIANPSTYAVPTLPVYSALPSIGPAPDSLVLITHGWEPIGLADHGTWIDDMADKISQRLGDSGQTNWHVAAYRWPGASFVAPDVALTNARNCGYSVGKQIVDRGWNHVHLIAHSAGGPLIQSAAQYIKAKSSITVHLTFLDPYMGLDDHWRQIYGLHADWADNYLSHDATDKLKTAFTEGKLPHVYNVDVSWRDPSKRRVAVYCPAPNSTPAMPCAYVAWSSHEWPHDFYNGSVTPGTDPYYPTYGFSRSKEGGGWDARGSYQVGNAPIILDESSAIVQGPALKVENPALQITTLPKANSITGQVEYSGLQVSLTTANSTPPQLRQNLDSSAQTADAAAQPSGTVWFSVAVDVSATVNYVNFKAQFNSGLGAVGLVAVYWNDEQIGTVDERYIPGGEQTYTFPLSSAFLDKNNSMSFRVDQFSSVPSSITISEVKTGFAGLPSAPSLTVSQMIPTAGLGLWLSGLEGYTYQVEASSDLNNWEPMAEVTTAADVFTPFLDPNALGLAKRFYRAVSP